MKPPSDPGGPESVNMSYPPTVERESTTVKKHEAHTRQTQSGREKRRRAERGRDSTHKTPNTLQKERQSTPPPPPQL